MDKPKTRKEKIKSGLRRAMWLFMALLFVVTGLGVGIYAFWQGTHQPKDNSSQSQDTSKLKGKPLAGFTPIAHVDGLQKIDQKAGTGAIAKASSTVTVIYTGAVAATGIVFESSADTGQPATFKLNQVIKGWQDGLPGMTVGGQRRLLIPAADAYGANPPAGSGIPPNADLVFDITLLNVQ
ncbi:MAG TPA: FKBP-type peptidyl-prolyl cis-trans isomerase [Candidatus Saccharimonadales bacterium]|nr:FKBP-type peptidyl-prolyl cis-trans isomerase [Candidatus Saccharimonadales bacterium]